MTWAEALLVLKTGGGVFVFGFSIVFVGLILLLGYIILQTALFKAGKNKSPKTKTNVKVKPSNDFVGQVALDEKKVIAAITAAVAVYMGTSAGDVVIRTYRRIGANSPAWRQAGRRDSIFNKF